MATGKKISALPAATAVTGSELTVVVQNAETRQATVDQVTANKVNRSGDYLTATQYVEFDTAQTSTVDTPGRLAWNVDDGTLDIGLLGGSILQVGQESLFYVKNTGAVDIQNGQMVMATGTVGASGKIAAGLAIGDGTVNAEYFLGIATQNIPVNAFGYVTHFGLVRGLNTTGAAYEETWADGDLIYVNAGVVGGLTNIAPAFPGFSTPVAIVINAGSGGSGSLFVRMKTGEYLHQLHDVDISDPVHGEALTWDADNQAWTNSINLSQLEDYVYDLLERVAILEGSAG